MKWNFLPYWEIFSLSHFKAEFKNLKVLLKAVEANFEHSNVEVPRYRIKESPIQHQKWKKSPLDFCSISRDFSFPMMERDISSTLKQKRIFLELKNFNTFLLQIHPLTTTGWMPVLLLIVLNICVVRGIANLNRKLPSQSLPNGKCLSKPRRISSLFVLF